MSDKMLFFIIGSRSSASTVKASKTSSLVLFTHICKTDSLIFELTN